jgi:hypothetical protein
MVNAVVVPKLINLSLKQIHVWIVQLVVLVVWDLIIALPALLDINLIPRVLVVFLVLKIAPFVMGKFIVMFVILITFETRFLESVYYLKSKMTLNMATIILEKSRK